MFAEAMRRPGSHYIVMQLLKNLIRHRREGEDEQDGGEAKQEADKQSACVCCLSEGQI